MNFPIFKHLSIILIVFLFLSACSPPDEPLPTLMELPTQTEVAALPTEDSVRSAETILWEITQDNVNAYACASRDCDSVRTLEQGEQIDVVSSEAGWHQVLNESDAYYVEVNYTQRYNEVTNTQVPTATATPSQTYTVTPSATITSTSTATEESQQISETVQSPTLASTAVKIVTATNPLASGITVVSTQVDAGQTSDGDTTTTDTSNDTNRLNPTSVPTSRPTKKATSVVVSTRIPTAVQDNDEPATPVLPTLIGEDDEPLPPDLSESTRPSIPTAIPDNSEPPPPILPTLIGADDEPPPPDLP